MDFQTLIRDLLNSEWTQTEIAAEVGCSQANIARLVKVTGAEPKWSVGQAIIDLHHDEVS